MQKLVILLPKVYSPNALIIELLHKIKKYNSQSGITHSVWLADLMDDLYDNNYKYNWTNLKTIFWTRRSWKQTGSPRDFCLQLFANTEKI